MQTEMLSEPVAVSDTHVTGGIVEETEDGNVRITFYISRPSSYGGTEHRVEFRAVMGQLSVRTLFRAVAFKIGCICGAMNKRAVH